MIEFALVIPILLALVLGIIEFGWIFNGYVTLNGAVREGARIASIVRVLPDDDGYDGYIEETVEAHVTNTLHSISVHDPEIVLEDGNPNSANYSYGVKIKADGKITPLIGFFVTGEFPLSAEATMRIQ